MMTSYGPAEEWRGVRGYLDEGRGRLAGVAGELYGGLGRVRGLLVREGWIPEEPVRLGDVGLRWAGGAGSPVVDGTEPETEVLRAGFSSYAEALEELAAPGVFEDRACYRLTELDWEGGRPRLTFGRGSYFDIINVSEAVAHELARVERAGQGDLAFRGVVGDPFDLTRRIVIPAISTLTIRRSRTGATVVLHHRDSAKVAHGGGLYQVMPVGVFQPSSSSPEDEVNDFDLWRSMAREYSEELLGHPEMTGPIDYAGWPFFQEMDNARHAGRLNVHWLGFGIDPLSLVADILAVAVFDEDVFDDLFAGLVSTNAEGTTIATVPFDEHTIERYAGREPMQAAGAAALDLAWRHRGHIM